MNDLDAKRTGRLRYKPETYKTWSGTHKVVIVQAEIEYFDVELTGGLVDGTFKKKWINARPEWLMVDPCVEETER